MEPAICIAGESLRAIKVHDNQAGLQWSRRSTFRRIVLLSEPNSGGNFDGFR